MHNLSCYMFVYSYSPELCIKCQKTSKGQQNKWTIQRNWQRGVHKTQDEDKQNKEHTVTRRKQTQIMLIRYEPSYKQLEVKSNRTQFLCRSRNEHHNTELRTRCQHQAIQLTTEIVSIRYQSTPKAYLSQLKINTERKTSRQFTINHVIRCSFHQRNIFLQNCNSYTFALCLL